MRPMMRQTLVTGLLRPCPTCGKTAVFHFGPTLFRIECQDVGCETRTQEFGYEEKDLAIAQWNGLSDLLASADQVPA